MRLRYEKEELSSFGVVSSKSQLSVLKGETDIARLRKPDEYWAVLRD